MTQIIKDIVTWLKQWFYTETEVDTLLNAKQNTLVSGTSIKTLNNQSLLGSGNITISTNGLIFANDTLPTASSTYNGKLCICYKEGSPYEMEVYLCDSTL